MVHILPIRYPSAIFLSFKLSSARVHEYMRHLVCAELEGNANIPTSTDVYSLGNAHPQKQIWYLIFLGWLRGSSSDSMLSTTAPAFHLSHLVGDSMWWTIDTTSFVLAISQSIAIHVTPEQSMFVAPSPK